ncbi:MAG TPA: sodium ion-translocating decarboxylase subunit beta, partial [Bacillota bacterium]|nr:sodium ion-translocating decarboxylase subunit beta [Bacillota bacterium]
MDFAQTFQGIGTMFYQDTNIVVARIVLIVLGIVLIWLGKRNTLEPLIMIPMGFGMAAVNAGVLFMSATTTGTLFVDPMVADTEG